MNTLQVFLRLLPVVFDPYHPFFAHLCVTELCNLRCRYCQVWMQPHPEHPTGDLQIVICRLYEMGVLVLSFTGGEPLLSDDIFDLIDFAAEIGFVTGITSNGALSLRKYETLLETKIDHISISLDGIVGNDLPDSKCSPKILETIEILNKDRKGKLITISTLVDETNEAHVKEIVEFCFEHQLFIWLQPAVRGKGKLRRPRSKVKPTFPDSKNVLNPEYFNIAAAKYFDNNGLLWDCHGGQLFFDIKPNGDFWICQDYPTSLNILDPQFEARWKEYDFHSARLKCDAGCIYSCYYCSQEGLKLKIFTKIFLFYIKYDLDSNLQKYRQFELRLSIWCVSVHLLIWKEVRMETSTITFMRLGSTLARVWSQPHRQPYPAFIGLAFGFDVLRGKCNL